jgi:hypothetical protein
MRNCAIYGDDDIIDTLLETHDINAADAKGHTALMFAAGYGQNETLKMLIEKQANLDLQTWRGLTALHWAAAKGHDEACSILIDAGASINIEDENEKTPLDVAKGTGNYNVITVFDREKLRRRRVFINNPQELNSDTKIQSVIRGKKNRKMIKEYKEEEEEEEKRIASKRRRARFLENNTKKSSKIPTAPPWARNQKLERERLELPKNIEKQRTTVKNSNYQTYEELAPRAENPGKPNESGNVGMADNFLNMTPSDRTAYLSKLNTNHNTKQKLLNSLYKQLGKEPEKLNRPLFLNAKIKKAAKEVKELKKKQ